MEVERIHTCCLGQGPNEGRHDLDQVSVEGVAGHWAYGGQGLEVDGWGHQLGDQVGQDSPGLDGHHHLQTVQDVLFLQRVLI